MSTLVLTTVGTTTLTNDYVKSLPNAVQNWAGYKEENLRANQNHEYALSRALVKNYEIAQRKSVSAEIASLSLIIEAFKIQPGDGSRFVFIHSQTNKGAACGRINILAFRDIHKTCDGCNVVAGECDHVKLERLFGVQHRNAAEFAKSIGNLAKLIEKEKADFAGKSNGSSPQFVFNITGAYKGIIPWATEACNQHGFEIAYLYEEADALITKPPMGADVKVYPPHD